jgi:hypothetical protein
MEERKEVCRDKGREKEEAGREITQEEEEEISKEEVDVVIKAIRTKKARGSNGIEPEVIKYGGRSLNIKLCTLLKEIWRTERIPTEWENNVIIPIHKKGDTTNCDNYRAICLSAVCLKLYSRIVEMKVREHVEHKSAEQRGAYRQYRQTEDHIYIH